MWLVKCNGRYAATDIDWKGWVDDKTLVFATRGEAWQYVSQYCSETGVRVVSINTVGR